MLARSGAAGGMGPSAPADNNTAARPSFRGPWHVSRIPLDARAPKRQGHVPPGATLKSLHDSHRSGAKRPPPCPALPVYGAAIFLSAALLFAVQPMFTKMVLPRLGGAPAVWSVAMVFFQALLLAGYGYAHLLTRMRRAASR